VAEQDEATEGASNGTRAKVNGAAGIVVGGGKEGIKENAPAKDEVEGIATPLREARPAAIMESEENDENAGPEPAGKLRIVVRRDGKATAAL
jgi:hypothetical protein